MQRLHLRISGGVQGVAFRAYAVRRARELRLNGWVRNRADGTVELVAEGDEPALRSLGQWCQVGPPAASVSNVEEQWLGFIGDLDPFTVRYG